MFISYLYGKPYCMRRKKLRVVLFVVAGIVFLLLAAVIVVHFVLPQRIQEQLQQELVKTLEQQHPDLYRVEVDEVTFSPLLRRMQVGSLKVVPDSGKLTADEAAGLPRDIFRLEAENLEIGVNGLLDVVRERSDIVFSQIAAQNVLLHWISNPQGTETGSGNDNSGWQPQTVQVRNLEVAVSKMENRQLGGPENPVVSTGSGRITGNIRYRLKNNEQDAQLSMSNQTLRLADIVVQPPEDLSRYRCDSLMLNGDPQTLELFGIYLEPLFDKQEFQKQIRYQTDRVEGRVQQARLYGFVLDELIGSKNFFADSLEIEDARLEVFRDRNLPHDTERRPPLPSRLINEAGLPLYLGKVLVYELDVVYQELPEDGSEEGAVPFIGLSAELRNITNVKDSLMQDSIMLVDARARVFGEPELHAIFHYNLQDIQGGYQAQGTLETFSFETINQAVYPLAGVKAAGGRHQQTRFEFSGNDLKSKGSLTLRYSGLDVDLDPEGGELRRAIANWAGSALVYHRDNPSNDDEPREGEIKFERDPTRFVFHYWWNAFLTGVRSTVLRDVVDEVI
jgi:hypothetical protein